VDDGGLCFGFIAMSVYLGTDNSVENAQMARTVILPVPAEFSTSYGKGTAGGPASIISASPFLEFYDEELDFEAWQTGIYTAPAVDTVQPPEKLMKCIEKAVRAYLAAKKFIIVLGGEHSISFGVHQAVHAYYPELSVLQFDAHSDLRESYEGSAYSHACVMRRIWEKNKNIVALGIRSQCIEEKEFIREKSFRIIYACQIYGRPFPETIVDELNRDVFITFDVDFFDPSIVPGTGTPEPGGFFWPETVAFLRRVFEMKNVVAVDLVEHRPLPGLVHPDFLLAKLIYKMIGYKTYNE
jgi:agmatinase